MAKENIDLSVFLHNDSDYKDWLVELKERFYSHRLKASCATNGYLLDFYWKLGRDIEAKQYTNNYGSGFYKNLSQDLKNEMPGVKGFSPTNLKYMSYFYKLYAPLAANRQQAADDFEEDLYKTDIQRVGDKKQNRLHGVDDFKILFFIPWFHHQRIIDKCKDDMDKAIKFYHLLAKNMRNIYKAIGDSISSGIVTNNDGNITTPTSNGHYNLFEFPSCDLSKTFKLEEGKL